MLCANVQLKNLIFIIKIHETYIDCNKPYISDINRYMSGIKFIGLAFRKTWFSNPQCLINHKNEIFYSTLYCIVSMFYIHLQHQIIQTVHSYECRQRKIANAQGHA